MARWRRRLSQGKKSPLDYRPKVPERLRWVFDGFVFLSRRRARAGFGMGPISVVEIRAYLDLHGVTDRRAAEGFAALVARMDDALLDWMESHG